MKKLLVLLSLALLIAFNPLNKHSNEFDLTHPSPVLTLESNSKENQNTFDFYINDQTTVSIHLDVRNGKIYGVNYVELIDGEDKTNIPYKDQKEFELEANSKAYDIYTLSKPSIALDTYRYSVDSYMYIIEDAGEKITIRLITHLEDAKGQVYFNEKHLDFSIVF